MKSAFLAFPTCYAAIYSAVPDLIKFRILQIYKKALCAIIALSAAFHFKQLFAREPFYSQMLVKMIPITLSYQQGISKWNFMFQMGLTICDIFYAFFPSQRRETLQKETLDMIDIVKAICVLMLGVLATCVYYSLHTTSWKSLLMRSIAWYRNQ